jgi:hypothetical protein
VSDVVAGKTALPDENLSPLARASLHQLFALQALIMAVQAWHDGALDTLREKLDAAIANTGFALDALAPAYHAGLLADVPPVTNVTNVTYVNGEVVVGDS